MSFFDLLKVDVRPFTKKVEGMSYIPWAMAYGMAGRPEYEVLRFDGGQPVRRLFGGTAVAVRIEGQDVYLPILDAKGKPIPAGVENARDVSDTIARAIARAIAIRKGLGLSLYSLCEGDGPTYVDCLAITPDTQDIAAVPPLRDSKSGGNRQDTEYLGWHAAVAACAITDPDFRWWVEEFPAGDGRTLPALKLEGGKGWMVSVAIRYKGREARQWLPIMGVQPLLDKNGNPQVVTGRDGKPILDRDGKPKVKKLDNQPIINPDVMDWHKGVMRCLAKCIAIHTGYGLALYAHEDVPQVVHDEQPQTEAPAPTPEQPQAAPTPALVVVQTADQPQDQRQALMDEVNALGQQTGVFADPDRMARFLAWLKVPSLDAASDEVLKRALQALRSTAQRATAAAA